MFDSNYLYFLHIPLPPNLYDLKRVEERAKNNKKNETFQRWEVEEIERKMLLRNYFPLNIVMVLKGEIIKLKQNPHTLIMGSMPALGSNKTKEDLEKHAGNPQFAFGQYYDYDKLFLLDDIMNWSHHRISWKEVRTVESFIKSSS